MLGRNVNIFLHILINLINALMSCIMACVADVGWRHGLWINVFCVKFLSGAEGPLCFKWTNVWTKGICA